MFRCILWVLGLLITVLPLRTLAQTPKEIESKLDSIQRPKDKFIFLLTAANDLYRSYPDEGLDYADKAIKLAVALKNPRLGADAYSVKGNILMNQGKYNDAIIPLKKSITYRLRYVKNEARQSRKLAQDYHLLGIAFEKQGNQKEADRIFLLQQKYALKSPSREEQAKALNNVGRSYLKQKNYKEALRSFNQAKLFAEEAGLRRTLIEIENNVSYTAELMQSNLSSNEYKKELDAISVAIETVKDSLTLARENNEVLLSEKEYLELESAKKELELKNAEQVRMRIEQEKEALAANLALQEEKERNYQIILLGGIFAAILLIWVALTMWQRALERKRSQKQIQEEKERADRLLENILPKQIAEELKSRNVVEPIEHQKVTILFTDFQGFTRIAAGMSPKQLLEHLDHAFHNFDIITTKYGLEKIKTIGDAYMAVAGLVQADPYQGINAVAAGAEMQDFMESWNKRQREEGKSEWKLRIGIHTGKVVAGVIGEKKFAYDVWGDDVNVASRMETSGQPGKVNISEATYKEVQTFVQVEPKRTVPVKNRGEVGMYFVRKITAKRSNTPTKGTAATVQE